MKIIITVRSRYIPSEYMIEKVEGTDEGQRLEYKRAEYHVEESCQSSRACKKHPPSMLGCWHRQDDEQEAAVDGRKC